MSEEEIKTILVTNTLLDQYRQDKKLARLVAQIEMQGEQEEKGYRVAAEAWENVKVDYGLSPMRGLGDVVAKVTKFLGITPCGGCNKRRKKMNGQ